MPWWQSKNQSVQSLSCVRLFVTPWTAAHQASLSITNSWSLLKLMSIESVMPSNSLILCCLFLLLSSIFPSIRVFSNESILHIRWPKYWSFSFSIAPFNEYSGLISFRISWFDLRAVQGTFKSLLQLHSSKASILQHSALFMVHLFPIPWTVALPVHHACPGQASLSITNSWSLFTLISIESVMPSNHLILSSLSLPTFNLSQHQDLFQ